MTDKKHFTYILRCSDDSLYTGYTTNLAKRLQTHNAGKGAKYTKARLPVEMVYHEEYVTKEEAMRREAAIKKLTQKTENRIDQESDKYERDKGMKTIKQIFLQM